MGLRQTFRFVASQQQIRQFLRGFEGDARVEDRGDFFVFSSRSEPAFEFDCEVLADGIKSERSGEYFRFLGVFVEALTGQFGKVEVEGACALTRRSTGRYNGGPSAGPGAAG